MTLVIVVPWCTFLVFTTPVHAFESRTQKQYVAKEPQWW